MQAFHVHTHYLDTDAVNKMSVFFLSETYANHNFFYDLIQQFLKLFPTNSIPFCYNVCFSHVRVSISILNFSSVLKLDNYNKDA